MGIDFELEDYTIKIKLPENSTDLLVFILTKLPGPSRGYLNKKKDVLTLEWHF
jgi:hypothetical protein